MVFGNGILYVQQTALFMVPKQQRNCQFHIYCLTYVLNSLILRCICWAQIGQVQMQIARAKFCSQSDPDRN